jgi:hypothetical protein
MPKKAEESLMRDSACLFGISGWEDPARVVEDSIAFVGAPEAAAGRRDQ